MRQPTDTSMLRKTTDSLPIAPPSAEQIVQATSRIEGINNINKFKIYTSIEFHPVQFDCLHTKAISPMLKETKHGKFLCACVLYVPMHAHKQSDYRNIGLWITILPNIDLNPITIYKFTHLNGTQIEPGNS